MGELLRRFWIPVLLSEELPEPDSDPKKIVVMGEELLAFRDSRGRGRRHRSILPASRRQSLVRPQRGMRHPLRLSRLEVRYRRPLRRHADLLSRPQCEGPDPHQVLSGARMGRHDLGLYGPGRGRCRNCRRWRWRCCRPRIASSPRNGRTATGCRRLEGSIDTAHFTFAHLSFEKEENEILDIKKHFVNPLTRVATDHMRWIAEDPRPVIKINPHEAGLDGRGRAAHRQRQHLLAHRPVPDAVPRLCAELDAGREYVRPDLRAGHRHQLLDLHLCLESGPAADRGRARRLSPTATA